jgi:hypothetical protein
MCFQHLADQSGYISLVSEFHGMAAERTAAIRFDLRTYSVELLLRPAGEDYRSAQTRQFVSDAATESATAARNQNRLTFE